MTTFNRSLACLRDLTPPPAPRALCKGGLPRVLIDYNVMLSTAQQTINLRFASIYIHACTVVL